MSPFNRVYPLTGGPLNGGSTVELQIVSKMLRENTRIGRVSYAVRIWLY